MERPASPALLAHTATCLLWGALSLVPSSVGADNGDEVRIGTVTQARGDIRTTGRGGVIRQLSRRDAINLGDTIIVSGGSFIQLKLTDDSRMALADGTMLTIGDYAYDGNPDTPDWLVMSMSRGCLRTIAGTTGTRQGDLYRLDTPFGSVSRPDTAGTTYRLAIADGVLQAGVSDGTLELHNLQGTLRLGRGESHQYAQVLEDVAPEPLPDEPAFLDQSCQADTLGAGDVPDLPLIMPARL